MYELALSEWGLTPEYINRHWTEELLARMFQVRSARLEERDGKAPSNRQEAKNWVSEEDMLKKFPMGVKRVKRKE